MWIHSARERERRARAAFVQGPRKCAGLSHTSRLNAFLYLLYAHPIWMGGTALLYTSDHQRLLPVRVGVNNKKRTVSSYDEKPVVMAGTVKRSWTCHHSRLSFSSTNYLFISTYPIPDECGVPPQTVFFFFGRCQSGDIYLRLGQASLIGRYLALTGRIDYSC